MNIRNINELFSKYMIVIPTIQRDYAQGRLSESVSAIRETFLDNIFKVLGGEVDGMQLNYIYGVPSDDENNDKPELVLIDGQQRVTTLFLVVLFLAAQNGKDDCPVKECLKYENRNTSKEFCEYIYAEGYRMLFETFSNDERPSDRLKNNIKFKKKWAVDPTVQNMLNMLDSIAVKMNRMHNFDKKEGFNRISNITFEFIPLEGYKETEKLYSTMNSRGKDLTLFEKCRVELLKKDNSLAETINDKWVPYFWGLSEKWCDNGANPIDFAKKNHDDFLYRYFFWVTKMLWYNNNEVIGRKKGGDSNSKTKEYVDVKLESIKKEDNPLLEELLNSAVESKVIATVASVYSSDENREFLKKAMDSSVLEKLQKDLDILHFERSMNTRTISSDDAPYKKKLISIFDNSDNVIVYSECFIANDLLKICCNKPGQFTETHECMFFAALKYYCDYYEKDDNDNNKKLIDYLTLMRGLITEVAYSSTTKNVKNSLTGWQSVKIVRAFCAIVSNSKDDISLLENTKLKDIHQKHKQIFDNSNSIDGEFRKLLNLPYIGGKLVFVNNTQTILDVDKTVQKNAYNNLKSLYSMEPLKRFNTIEINRRMLPILIDFNGVKKRLCPIANDYVITSLLQSIEWVEDPARKSFIKTISLDKLPAEKTSYDKNDWKYYYNNYPSFRSGKPGCFDCDNDNLFVGEIEYIEKERSDTYTHWNPYIYSVFIKCKNLDEKEVLNKNYREELRAFGKRFSNFTENSIAIDGKEYKFDYTCEKDVVEQIIGWLA